jgi:hypothetical protein
VGKRARVFASRVDPVWVESGRVSARFSVTEMASTPVCTSV